MEVKTQSMNTKTTALAVLAIVAIAAVAGSLAFAMQPTAKADSTTTPIVSDTEQTPAAITAPADNFTFNPGFMDFRGHGMMAQGFGGMGPGGMCREGMGSIQVSADFTANVTNIANNDTDVQNLISQGYNITSIHPVITTSIDGNGNVVTKASTADVTLMGTNDRAFVVVDLTQAKVTKIVTITMTEIDK
jgi:hypothetical protein